MPATDERQIFNFEHNFERAVESILEGAGITAMIQGANESLPESRVEITFAAGEALNTSLHPSDPDQLIYDFFYGTLTLRVVTVRPDDRPSLIPGVGQLHEQWAAAVRQLLQERLNPFTTTNLPYYAVKTIRPQASARDLDPRWMEDYTRLNFAIEFGIRSDAWPAL